MNNKVIKIVDIFLVIITLIMTVFTCSFLYVKFSKNVSLPTAVTSTYATKMTDPMTGEEYSAIEANYYSNLNNTGYEVVELVFNCYSGISKQAIYSRGYQLIYDKDGNIVKYTDPATGQYSNVWELNRNNSGQSFITGHQYNMTDPMIIDIDGTTYAVKLDGTYDITTKKFSFLKAVGHTFTGLWTGYDYGKKAYNFETTTYNYSFEDLLLKVKEIIRSSSNGTGQSTLALVDLGNFLHIYSVDDKGQISAEPVGVRTLQNSYFTMDTNFSNSGMVWATQSIFGSVAGKSDFNISGINDNVNYWQSKTRYILKESDFTARYVPNENGYYFGLSQQVINEVNSFDNIEVYIEFNASNFKDINVLGFDNYALYGIKVSQISISSDIQQEFDLMVGALKDTGINASQIITQNIVINNLYSEVA